MEMEPMASHIAHVSNLQPFLLAHLDPSTCVPDRMQQGQKKASGSVETSSDFQW